MRSADAKNVMSVLAHVETTLHAATTSRASLGSVPATPWAPPVLAPNPAPHAEQDASFDELLEQSLRKAQSGDYQGARRLARRAQHLRPHSAWLHQLLGDIAREFGNEELAAWEYRRALELDDSLVAANLGLGQALCSLGLSAQGETYLLRAVAQLGAMSPHTVVYPFGLTAKEALYFAQKSLPSERS